MKTVSQAKELLAALPRKKLGFYPTHLHRLERLSARLGVELYLKRDDLSGVNLAPGYEIPNEAGNEAVRLLARTEGILLDTVYSGKGFAGMLDQIRTGRIPQGSRVVYWHTGGATALFAEAAMVGDVAEN